MAHPFERLHAWQLAHRLTLSVYKQSAPFPAAERYGLTAQVRRAAASVPANIAEGSTAGSHKEFARYLTIARKSANEVAYWLILARDLGYVSGDDWRMLNEATHHVGRTVWALEQQIRGA